MALLTAISLFSGVGMLDEGLRAGLEHMGIAHRTLCHVEREAHAAAVLVARMEEGSLDAAPVWPDVTTFDAAAWHGKVDCIVAGFPCQDLSVAGERAGLDGKRSGLFFEVLRVAADSGAWLIFLENVAGISSATATVMDPQEGELDERAAARVVGELADLGWDAEWLTLSASAVGASHGRDRWFCLAWRMGHTRLQHLDLQQREDGSEHPRTSLALDDAQRPQRGPVSLSADRGEQGHDRQGKADSRPRIASPSCMGDPASDRRHQGRPELSGRPGRSDPGGTSLSVADTQLAPGIERPEPDVLRRWPNQTEQARLGGSGMAHADRPRCKGNQQPARINTDGRTDGRTDGARVVPTNCPTM